MFLLSERYRLELRWEKALYEKDGICSLVGAYFCGPALQDAEKINDNDYIMLDFFSQYLVLVSNVYVGKLSWGEVSYTTKGRVTLNDAKISHDTELNKVPKLNSSDYLVIDTSRHEASMHAFNMVYKTYVINDDDEQYNFRSK